MPETNARLADRSTRAAASPSDAERSKGLSARFWSRRRVCITGGTGFLGRHILRQVLPLAAQVRVFGLRPSADLGRPYWQECECIFGDIRDAQAVGRALKGCDVIFHAAGNV